VSITDVKCTEGIVSEDAGKVQQSNTPYTSRFGLLENDLCRSRNFFSKSMVNQQEAKDVAVVTNIER
jgi:hypothetical protein